MLELRSRDIPELKDYLQKETFKSTSPTIQGELIGIVEDLIQKRIVNEVTEIGAFSLIVDETQDISVHDNYPSALDMLTRILTSKSSFWVSGILPKLC